MTLFKVYSPADILVEYLLGAALGVDPSQEGDWTIQTGSQPQSPQRVITVTNTLGVKQGRVMAGGEVEDKPGFQLAVRAPDDHEASAKIWALAEAVDGIRRATVTLTHRESSQSYRIDSVTRGSVISAGQEPQSQRRYLFTLNGTLTITSL